MDVIVGIDPGLSGSICLMPLGGKTLEPGSIVFQPFPSIAGQIDFQGLRQIFTHIKNAKVFIEKVGAMPGQGVCSMFTFGKVTGATLAMINAFALPYEEITPQAWQKEMLMGIPLIEKANGKKDTKAMAALVAQRLFPEIHLKKSEKGHVDALLIAEYGRRKIINGLTQNVVSIK